MATTHVLKSLIGDVGWIIDNLSIRLLLSSQKRPTCTKFRFVFAALFVPSCFYATVLAHLLKEKFKRYFCWSWPQSFQKAISLQASIFSHFRLYSFWCWEIIGLLLDEELKSYLLNIRYYTKFDDRYSIHCGLMTSLLCNQLLWPLLYFSSCMARVTYERMIDIEQWSAALILVSISPLQFLVF